MLDFIKVFLFSIIAGISLGIICIVFGITKEEIIFAVILGVIVYGLRWGAKKDGWIN